MANGAAVTYAEARRAFTANLCQREEVLSELGGGGEDGEEAAALLAIAVTH